MRALSGLFVSQPIDAAPLSSMTALIQKMDIRKTIVPGGSNETNEALHATI
jgi:hypothetical protein